MDGRGHSILNIDMNRPDEARVGLFAVKEEGLVANLSIDSQSTIIGGDRTGSFFGSLEYARAYGLSSQATVTGSNYAGGIAGAISGWEDDTVIAKSAFEGVVTGVKAGGITGGAIYGWTVQDVYVDSTVVGTIAGGVIGSASDSCGYRILERAVVLGTVNGSSYSGGLVGSEWMSAVVPTTSGGL